MHVLVGFIIGITLISGFQDLHKHPEGHSYLTLDSDGDVRINTYTESAEEIAARNIVMQEHDYSCGSAALATLLNYHLGEEFTERQVIRGLMNYGNLEKIKERKAFSLLDMKQFVDTLGYGGQGYSADMEDLEGLDDPVVLPIEMYGYQHFVVFRGMAGDRVFLADPWLGHSTYTRDDFEDMWYENVLFMVDPKGRPTRSMLSLSEEDMRYIDVELERYMLFPHGTMHPEIPSVRKHKTLYEDLDIYKR